MRRHGIPTRSHSRVPSGARLSSPGRTQMPTCDFHTLLCQPNTLQCTQSRPHDGDGSRHALLLMDWCAATEATLATSGGLRSRRRPAPLECSGDELTAGDTVPPFCRGPRIAIGANNKNTWFKVCSKSLGCTSLPELLGPVNVPIGKCGTNAQNLSGRLFR